MAGVNDDTLVECNFLDIRETEDLMMLGLSTTKEMSGIFEPKMSSAKKSEIKRYVSIIETLNEELYHVHTASENDKCRILMLEAQIDKLIKLLGDCQEKILEVSEELVKRSVIESVLKDGQ